MKRRVLATLSGVLLLLGTVNVSARAQEPAAANPEIERLKAQLAAQQAQIDRLRKTLDEQMKVLDQASQPKEDQKKTEEASQPNVPSLGQVASTSAVIPSGDVAPVLHPGVAAALTPSLQTPGGPPESPLQLHIGSATITPIGFMDMTAVFRSADGGSSIGTNFGSIPYNNVSTGLGKLSETRFSAQNSRIGARVDADVHGTHVLGYWESDFLGNQSTNVAVTSNSITFRLRLYYVDLRNGKWELLGGQSWSMMTPGRKGISPLPADVFYSQDMDTNYQVGITWTRAPQFRVVYHASDVVSLGFALESPDQYGGGSGGAGSIALPSLLSTAYTNNQIDLGGANFTVPNLHPDVQAKLAFDPVVNGNLLHFEVGGVFSSFKTYNPLTSTSFTKQGGGGEANFNLELTKGFHAILNTFLSDGEGRYLFGEAPDLIITGHGRSLAAACRLHPSRLRVHDTQQPDLRVLWGRLYRHGHESGPGQQERLHRVRLSEIGQQPKPPHPGRHDRLESDVLEESDLRGVELDHAAFLPHAQSVVCGDGRAGECARHHGVGRLALHAAGPGAALLRS